MHTTRQEHPTDILEVTCRDVICSFGQQKILLGEFDQDKSPTKVRPYAIILTIAISFTAVLMQLR